MGRIIDRRRVMGKKGAIDYSKQYMTFEVVEGGNITFTASNANFVRTIQYSLDDGVTWTSVTSSTTPIELGGNLSIGDKVLVKSNGSLGNWQHYYNYFGGSAKVVVYGNTMSLLYDDNFIGKTDLLGFCFINLFSNYTNLVSAANLILPSRVSTASCYLKMFYRCINLINAPKIELLEANAKSCCNNMFSSCSNLIEIPSMNIESFGQYSSSSMFRDCAKLVASPIKRITQTVAQGNESTYANSSLEVAPELLISKIPFYGFRGLFSGCSKLKYIKCLATDISAKGATLSWVSGVATNGIFVKHPDATWSTGVSGIPSGWTVLEAVAITVTYSAGNSGAYLKETGASDIMHIFIDGETYEGEFDDAKTYEIYDANDNLIDTLATPFNRDNNYTI